MSYPFKSGLVKTLLRTLKHKEHYYNKLWLFCQVSYNKVATNGLQAHLKLESVLYERKNRWR
ncbi:hypothetical protein HMPREF1392_00428 [Helicobacter pylori GAM101Biv]|nr:hypothetical protein HMPREF1392_00428 [Helicobacter pylori GAM101Biv]